MRGGGLRCSRGAVEVRRGQVLEFIDLMREFICHQNNREDDEPRGHGDGFNGCVAIHGPHSYARN